jgi:hypothetical protein
MMSCINFNVLNTLIAKSLQDSGMERNTIHIYPKFLSKIAVSYLQEMLEMANNQRKLDISFTEDTRITTENLLAILKALGVAARLVGIETAVEALAKLQELKGSITAFSPRAAVLNQSQSQLRLRENRGEIATHKNSVLLAINIIAFSKGKIIERSYVTSSDEQKDYLLRPGNIMDKLYPTTEKTWDEFGEVLLKTELSFKPLPRLIL